MNLAEGVQNVSFAILAVMMLGAALGVVLLPNIVHSAFLLGGVFISLAGLYLLLNADFVAAAQVLIYVGAVNVLILFAIMLVNRREPYTVVRWGWLRSGATVSVCIGLFAFLGSMIFSTHWALKPIVALPSTVSVIGIHFFTDFLLPFEVASILLLIALVGAIVLARREYLPDEATGEEFELVERPRDPVAALAEAIESPLERPIGRI
ncbi:NADH-quinone oxidoreductase subunit J [Leptolyngbya sp. FACHB-261]|uniref:NADH-quinone oxidoreductase subunit J n=1 Tax=Leptolyngbya sp. FACHB-261 TaxID=2692806 RepID=UPI0016831B7F|nr:NADH-quinone oxidoreductase subunit J [Leptolyngbya sp. FACHB-261]MBD2102271.1 NADH-quinone oxidoreductase subunit J [Leptolyngbya sp. FACHB-261]